MKSIWNEQNSKNSPSSLIPVNERPITQQQFEDLVDRINTAIDLTEESNQRVEDLIESQKALVSTEQVNASNILAETANIDNLSGNILNFNLLEVQNVISADATIDRAILNEITSQDAQIGNLSSDTIKANEATLDNIKAENIETESLSVNNFAVGELEVEKGRIGEFLSDKASIADLTAGVIDTSELEAQEAKLDEAEIGKAEITEAEITHQDTTYITHLRDPQEVDEVADTGDFYILLPIYTNGFYYLEMRNDTDKILGSIEILNSVKSFMFKWSIDKFARILEIKVAEDASGVNVVQLHCKALNEHVTLYRQCQSTSNVNSPAIYDSDQLPSVQPVKQIIELEGTYIQGILYTDKLHTDDLEMENLFLDCLGVCRELWLTDHWEEESEVQKPFLTPGRAGDYVANEEDPVTGIVHPRWQQPSQYVDSTDKCLIPSCAVAKYTGEEYAGTKECDIVECHYPIVHLGDDTCVHGSAKVEENLTVSDKVFVGNAADIPALQENSLVVNEDGIYRCNTDEDSNPILNEILPYDSTCAKDDQKPLIYNQTTNALQTTDHLDIECMDVDNLNVRCCANVGMDLTVGGDLYVRGTTHSTESVNISTGADIITLRQNNPAGLATGEASGLIIHNYNGSNNLAVVVDNTGTLRIGDVSGSETSYDDIYYKDGLWYSDEDATTQITPNGELTAYAEKIVEHDNPITHYKGAVFTDFSYEDLSPVLGRDELANMTDKGLLFFNAATWEAETLQIPTTNGSSLFWDADSETYYWKLASGIYRFETEADYEAVKDTIAAGSLVMIEKLNNHMIGEDIKGDLIIDIGGND